MRNVEKWSLTYEVLRPFVRLAHRLIHKEFHVIGRSNIPKDKPVVFAPNHQNGLMDDMVIVTTAPGQTVFLGRADIFKSKIIRVFLKFVKIIPIYRIRDGKEALKKNEETFYRTIEIMNSNTNICLYPEAAQIGKRSMLPHKKAIPRIVFKAHDLQKNEVDIQIVPVGLTFSSYFKFRRNLVVQYGKPISSKEYCKIYAEEGEHAATNALKSRIYNEIESLIVNIPEAELTDVYESAFRIIRPTIFKKLGLKKNAVGKLEADQLFTQKLHEQFKNDTDKKDEIVSKQREFERLRKKLKLKSSILQKKKFTFNNSLLTILVALITLPITLMGAIINGWLFYLTQYPIRKKIKDYTFWSTISWGAGLVGFLIYDILLWILLSYLLHSILWAYVAVFAISIAGIIAWDVKEKISYYDQWMAFQ